jgi:hypothetical protein
VQQVYGPEPPTRGSAVALPQHADEHRPQRPVLLAVDQQIRSARSKSGNMRTWSSSARGSGTEGVKACSESAFQLVGSHGGRLR